MPIDQNLRLYLDETGDHKSTDPQEISKRYLGLCGVIFERPEAEKFAKALEEFKRKHLSYDQDDPPILHRKEILFAQGPFHVLQDPAVRQAFDSDLLQLIKDTRFKIVVVVLDKVDHLARTYRTLKHPYHYCLLGMLERYCGWLERISKKRDIIAESRGGTEDSSLKQAFSEIYTNGGYYLPATRCQATLTSKKMKIKPKVLNIAGLQLADLLAHPLTRDVLRSYNRITGYESPFQQELIKIVESKYNRQIYTGQINGYGRVFLF